MGLNLSNTEIMILNMLIENASSEEYGWNLIQRSNGSLKRGTAYVTLNRMEEKGFIESRKEEQRPGERGTPRRLYKITGMGHRVLGLANLSDDGVFAC